MIIKNNMFKKDRQHINGRKNYNEVYQRKKSTKKTMHCPLAILDILNAIFVNDNQAIDYFLTHTNILIKTEYASFKLPIPADNQTLIKFLNRINTSINIDKLIFEKIILENSDLKNMLSKHCLDCYILEECKTIKMFLLTKSDSKT